MRISVSIYFALISVAIVDFIAVYYLLEPLVTQLGQQNATTVILAVLGVPFIVFGVTVLKNS